MLQDKNSYRIPRQRMVTEQLMERGISDSAVLQAMNEVPRHMFVPEALVPTAYDDRPLPIGYGQTISQPLVVGMMCQLLETGGRSDLSVLEIGTGSGYQAAVLYSMGLTVFTVERLEPLYRQARAVLDYLGMRRLRSRLSDGTMGWPEMGPFDRIIVAAGGPGVPEALTEQLADGGVMVIPVGKKRGAQTLVQVRRRGSVLSTKNCGSVAFVDLVGNYGWHEERNVDEDNGLRWR